MKITHPNLRAELIYLIGRASAPVTSAELYDRCELADDVVKVSKALNNLCELGKIERAPGEGRARYVLPAGTKTSAPAGKAGRSKAVQRDDATRADVLPAAREPAENPPKPATATAPAPDHIVDANKMLADAHRAPPEPTQAKADAKLADAILARLKRDLAPLFGKPVVSDLDITTAPGAIHISVDRVEINISVGVQP